MLLANGTSLGYWVIEDINTDNSLYSEATGHVPRRQKFSIKLRVVRRANMRTYLTNDGEKFE